MVRTIIFAVIFFSCNGSYDSHSWLSNDNDSVAFAKSTVKEYPRALSDDWYQGKAEVSTFTLKQNRYKDLHDGEVVQIFVSEDFLLDKQVKNDKYKNPNSVPIIKNNSIRKFTTGIYDYSMYTSVFTNVKTRQDVSTLKVTMSSQDWCGQSFVQLNKRGKDYQMQQFSYFESEGDKKTTVVEAMLMDEIFNLIRIDPSLLPEGRIKVIPSMLYSRLKHSELLPVDAIAIKSEYQGDLVNGENLVEYKIEMKAQNASFSFIYHDDGTHEILAWTEKYPSVFDHKIRETVAVRKAVKWIDYWSKNGVEDVGLRSEMLLGS